MLNHLFFRHNFGIAAINPSSYLRWLSSGWSRSSDCTAGRERAVSCRRGGGEIAASQTGEQRQCETIRDESVKRTWRNIQIFFFYSGINYSVHSTGFQWKISPQIRIKLLVALRLSSSFKRLNHKLYLWTRLKYSWNRCDFFTILALERGHVKGKWASLLKKENGHDNRQQHSQLQSILLQLKKVNVSIPLLVVGRYSDLILKNGPTFCKIYHANVFKQ